MLARQHSVLWLSAVQGHSNLRKKLHNLAETFDIFDSSLKSVYSSVCSAT